MLKFIVKITISYKILMDNLSFNTKMKIIMKIVQIIQNTQIKNNYHKDRKIPILIK